MSQRLHIDLSGSSSSSNSPAGTSAVTSLAVNLHNARDESRLLQSRHAAQLSVLQALLDRMEKGELVSADEQRREFQRVGLVQRPPIENSKTRVGWREMLFGRKKTENQLAEERKENEDIEQALALVERGDEIASTSMSPSILTEYTKHSQAATAAVTASSAVLPAKPTRFASEDIARPLGTEQAKSGPQIVI
ncbi:MAG: hypothetical protein CYPHOPRED_005278 [Cyphobasidiales sp. Tagirdzhanova-0007]|nr:MAG: hypothetical protein CYPHOPRED_005278 [Cyphobasidiales sp. Tagirdzhanova-0007]